MPADMKHIIASAFVDMTKEKGIDKITVKSLIDACNISRQTFYYHFQDIMEVIEWAVEQATKSTLARGLEAETPEDALSVLITSATENGTLIRRLLDSQKRAQIEKLFVQASRTFLQEFIRNRPQKLSLNYSDMEVALDFWAFGISGLLLKYSEQDHIDAKALACQIYQLLPGKIENNPK